MVATLLRLRLRVLANSLTRSTWQLVATAIGALYGVGVLLAVAAGAVALGLSGSIELATTIVVLAGSLLTLGWVLFPLLLTGIEQTLDPAHLVQYPIPLRTLLISLTLAGVIGIPGAVSLLAGLASAAAWLSSPAAVVAGVVCAVLGVVTAVVASRAMAALSIGLQSSRRARELSGVIIIIPLLLLGPIIIGFTQGLSSSAGALPGVAAALGWSPLGAAWAVPAAVALGDVGGAGLRLLIALVTLAVLFWIWRGALARALVTPVVAHTRTVSRGTLGAFARVPQTPAGAIAARCLTYWRRDPRYARQLVAVPLIPVLLWFYSLFNDAPALLMWTGPLLGLTFALTLASDISYDGTAFATHVIDGVRGRDDRLGRLAALGLFAVPITVVAGVAGVALADQWPRLPVILGLSIGTLLTGMGVVCISSARFVMPVPQAGDNPFKSAQGSNFTTGLQVLAVWGIVLALMIPTGALAIASFVTGSAAFGWGALACGIVIGATVLIVGVRAGGALLDRTAPTLLMQLRRLKGA